MKTYKYTAELCNGELSTFTVPRFFDPKEVAKALPHSLVYLHLDKKMAVSAVGWMSKFEEVTEPNAVMIIDGEYYKVPSIPTTEQQSFEFWRMYGPKKSA